MAKRRPAELTPVSRELLETVGKIIGDGSAAAAALKRADDWMAEKPGREAKFYFCGDRFTVECVEA